MKNEIMSILEGKSLADLRAIALQMGVSGAERMHRNTIIRALTAEQAQQTTETIGNKDSGTAEAPVSEPKRRGRKKKVTDEVPAADNAVPAAAAVSEAPAEEAAAEQPAKPRRGRKPGSKNKKTLAKQEQQTDAAAETPSVAETAQAAAEAPAAEPAANDAPSADAGETQTSGGRRPVGRRAYTRRRPSQGAQRTDAATAQASGESTDTAVSTPAAPVETADKTEHTVETAAAPSAETSEGKAPETYIPEPIPDDEVGGVLEIMPDGYGFLRTKNYLAGSDDVYVSPSQIKRFGLRPGDRVDGTARKANRGEKFRALSYIYRLNDDEFIQIGKRPRFENLTPIYPDEKLKLETEGDISRINGITARILDIMAPIGRGQRGLIVSPPKAGKTELLKKIAHGITANHPDISLIVLLIDERPEEVTDMQRSINGEIVYSTFDEEPEHHVKAAEMVQEHAKRMVEQGKDVVILMDSLTRLTRAYNLTITNSGRTMSGGVDTAALIKPKKFLGAARNIEFGGSLTIIATALVDTGSKMDDLIYEEFKGTGNLEIHLDRKLSERRIFPAIDIYKSGTRRDDLLLTQTEKDAADRIRRALSTAGVAECTEMMINQMMKTPNNASFLMTMKV